MEEQAQSEQANPQMQARIRASFERQGLMRYLGARLGHIGQDASASCCPTGPK